MGTEDCADGDCLHFAEAAENQRRPVCWQRRVRLSRACERELRRIRNEINPCPPDCLFNARYWTLRSSNGQSQAGATPGTDAISLCFHRFSFLHPMVDRLLSNDGDGHCSPRI
jgi:hypothetical protein